MTLALADAARLSDADLARLLEEDPATFERLFGEVLQTAQATAEEYERSRRDWQLSYHTCANPDARPIHTSVAREVAVNGGNRSSKTSESLAELAIQATNHVPGPLKAIYPREKLRGPIRARVICNSLTDVLEPIIKPKLRYTDWNGVGDPIDGKGHYGWIPRQLLRNSAWDRAYSDKYRHLWVGVDSAHLTGGVLMEIRQWSQIQFMSYDQDLSAFQGSSMHLIIHDEVPRADVYRESRARTLDTKGQIITAFTPPDEPGANVVDVAFFFDEVFERGLPGPNRHPDFETINLFTEHNRILDPSAVRALWEKLSPMQREVRMHGRFVHLTGVIFRLFTDYDGTWCFRCHDRVLSTGGPCVACGGDDLQSFTHVIPPFEIPRTWPIVFVVDPHFRKPATCGYFAVTPSDDLLMVGELAVETDAGMTRMAETIRAYEAGRRFHVVKRLMDPNIATETNNVAEAGWTMRGAFDRVGLRCDLANDSLAHGINNVNELLKVDPRTRKPRFQSFSTNHQFNHAMKRWAWDDWRRPGEREMKQTPKDLHKDWCDLVKYAANGQFTWNMLATNAYRGGLRVNAGGRY